MKAKHGLSHSADELLYGLHGGGREEEAAGGEKETSSTAWRRQPRRRRRVMVSNRQRRRNMLVPEREHQEVTTSRLLRRRWRPRHGLLTAAAAGHSLHEGLELVGARVDDLGRVLVQDHGPRRRGRRLLRCPADVAAAAVDDAAGSLGRPGR
jgi:hypothetical protein